MTDEQLIEAVAKAICGDIWERYSAGGSPSDLEVQKMFKLQARAAIEAMKENGWGMLEKCYCGTIDNPNRGYCPYCVKWFDWAEQRMRKAGWGNLAAERERCARVCEQHRQLETCCCERCKARTECAAAIRGMNDK